MDERSFKDFVERPTSPTFKTIAGGNSHMPPIATFILGVVAALLGLFFWNNWPKPVAAEKPQLVIIPQQPASAAPQAVVPPQPPRVDLSQRRAEIGAGREAWRNQKRACLAQYGLQEGIHFRFPPERPNVLQLNNNIYEGNFNLAGIQTCQ